MDGLLFKLAAFVVAIGVLVTVHEFGHFWVARRLGIRVLRFSIGFGRPLWRHRGRDGTEYVIAAIPLGGYVKMLDEREGEVPAAERHLAFNRQSLPVRSAVVVAGPAFNFLFAILAFWVVLVSGETGLRPLVGEVRPGSPAATAGLEPGDEILAVNGHPTPTWSIALYELAATSVSDSATRLRVRRAGGEELERTLPAGEVGDLAESPDLLKQLGIAPERPRLPPVFGEVLPGEPAAAAGLRPGDRVLSADGVKIDDWNQWVEYVRARPGKTISLVVERDGAPVEVELTPAPVAGKEGVIGRIGARNQARPDLLDRYRVEYRLGPLEAVPVALTKTWDFSVLTLKVLWRVLIGEASVMNLSGPISIADTAGRSAEIGMVYFLKFLAIVSISLGVLNLLPVPVLDGGHLLFFALEAIRGRPLSEAFVMQGQRIGLALLLGLMLLAFYVDLARLLG